MPLRFAIVGTGGMAHSHVQNISALKGVRLVACSDIDSDRARGFAEQHKIPNAYSDLSQMLRNEALDALVNATPDHVHAEVAIEAARAGLHILSEKPLAENYDTARKMLRAVRKAGVVNMVNFSYRDSAALQEAARLVAQGKIGRVMHVETSYLQSWLSSRIWGDWRTDSAWLWRLSTGHGSLGTLGDIGCHLYDATSLLAGEFREIHCRLETFDKKVRGHRIGPYKLDANDSFTSSIQFRNGALGMVHASRWATGHANSLRFRVFGDLGAIEIDLDRSWDDYRICKGKRNVDSANWETVTARPSPNMHYRFVRAIRTGKLDPSDFENGLRVQRYLHLSAESARTGSSLRVPKR